MKTGDGTPAKRQTCVRCEERLVTRYRFRGEGPMCRECWKAARDEVIGQQTNVDEWSEQFG